MKKISSVLFSILLSIALMSALNISTKEPQVNRFEIANLEVSNLETGSFSKYLFKKINCENGGYAFFSPFYEDKTLSNCKVDAIIKGNEVKVVLKNDNKPFDFTISDFKVSEDKNTVDFIITKDNYKFPSKVIGVNLTEKYVINTFQKLSDINISKDNYPSSAIIISVYTSYQMMEATKNVQNACFPCNGTLKVQRCACDCSPITE